MDKIDNFDLSDLSDLIILCLMLELRLLHRQGKIETQPN